MKLPSSSVLLSLLAVAALAGCSPKETTPAPAPAASAPATLTVSASGTIELSAGDNMKYNFPRIEVAAGQALKLTLTNTGNLPKATMSHNFVLLKQGVSLDDFAQAAATAKPTDYIPVDRQGDIIAHTKSLGARESDTIEFTAPTQPGEYTFICTFPGHYLIGMRGVMVVK